MDKDADSITLRRVIEDAVAYELRAAHMPEPLDIFDDDVKGIAYNVAVATLQRLRDLDIEVIR